MTGPGDQDGRDRPVRLVSSREANERLAAVDAVLELGRQPWEDLMDTVGQLRADVDRKDD